jgi:hypothetical protein
LRKIRFQHQNLKVRFPNKFHFSKISIQKLRFYLFLSRDKFNYHYTDLTLIFTKKQLSYAGTLDLSKHNYSGSSLQSEHNSGPLVEEQFYKKKKARRYIFFSFGKWYRPPYIEVIKNWLVRSTFHQRPSLAVLMGRIRSGHYYFIIFLIWFKLGLIIFGSKFFDSYLNWPM